MFEAKVGSDIKSIFAVEDVPTDRSFLSAGARLFMFQCTALNSQTQDPSTNDRYKRQHFRALQILDSVETAVWSCAKWSGVIKSLSLPCFRSIRCENPVALTGVASSTLPFPGVVTKACIS